MDVKSGRLVADMQFLDEADRKNFIAVPDALRDLAAAELNGQQETVVNLRRRNELTRWATAERTKNRARNQMAKKSRAKNRTR